MLPALIPTADLRPMLDFARAGSVAALFFFDDAVLARRRAAAMEIDRAEMEIEERERMMQQQQQQQHQLSSSGMMARSAAFSIRTPFASSGTFSGSFSSSSAAAAAAVGGVAKSSPSSSFSPPCLSAAEEAESTSVCNILWPVMPPPEQQHELESADFSPAKSNHNEQLINHREAILDDEETELLLNLQDSAPLAKQTRRSRAKSIVMLRDKNKSGNLFADQFFTANYVGGEDGMRLLLAAIAPKNRQRFGVFGSVVETGSMAQRLSCSSIDGDSAVEAVNRAKFKEMRDLLGREQRKKARKTRRVQIDREVGRLQNLHKNATSASTTRATLLSYEAMLEDLDAELGVLDQASDDDYGPEAAVAEAGASASQGGGGKADVNRSSAQQNDADDDQRHAHTSSGNNRNSSSNANHRSFFSFAAYIEELRDNAVEAFGAASFVRQVAAILRRVSIYIGTSPSAAKKADNQFESGESYGIDIASAVAAVSHNERFHAFSIFFEAGLTYLILGSSRLALTHLVRAGTIIGAMLRGERPPPLLLRLRVLLCLALTKFFAGFALQRGSFGVEAAQELQRARHLLFDADAMCRAMLRPVSGTEERTLTQRVIAAIVNRSDDYCTRNTEPEMFADNHDVASKKAGGGNNKNGAAAASADGADAVERQQQQRRLPNHKAASAADKRRGGASASSASLDDVCQLPGGMRALEVVRRVTRSFVRHCMLHEAHALASTVTSPLLFHTATAASSVAGLTRVPATLRNAVAGSREMQEQQEMESSSSSTAMTASASAGKSSLESCLRALKVLDDMKDAMHDVVASSSSASASATSSDALKRQQQQPTSNNRVADSAVVGDIFVLAETSLSLLLAVAFSPDISFDRSSVHIAAIGARTFLSRGVTATTQLIDSCRAVLRLLYPCSSQHEQRLAAATAAAAAARGGSGATANGGSNQGAAAATSKQLLVDTFELDVDSPWLLQRPILRPGLIISSLLRHAHLMRAIFHSLRLMWPDAAGDLSTLVQQIELAEEPVPRHIYGTLKLVNTALMQQRHSVHLVRTSNDMLPPVLPVEESRLSSENAVLLKLLPVIELLRQMLIDATAARATVEVNFLSNGVMAERVAWRTFLEQEGGVGGALLADGVRLEDYGASTVRTAHMFDDITVNHLLEARRQAKLSASTKDQQQHVDHKFLLPPFPFAATLRCDVTGALIPLQLDAGESTNASSSAGQDTNNTKSGIAASHKNSNNQSSTSTSSAAGNSSNNILLFHQCRACGLRVSPEAYEQFQNNDKRVCISKLVAASLCHVGCEVRHTVSAHGNAGLTRVTVADLLAIKDDADAERMCSGSQHNNSAFSGVNDFSRSITAFQQQNQSQQQHQQQQQQQQQQQPLKWEAEWKVGRMHVWDPISFMRFECQSPSDSLLCDTLAESYRCTANNAYEMMLWNPTSCGPRPEAEPIVWVMPPESASLAALQAEEKRNRGGGGRGGGTMMMMRGRDNKEKAKANADLRHILASKDLGLILKHHMSSGTADVVPANCLEVIRDRVEDASSDHIHRMVRCHTTRTSASETLKQSCCVVCHNSLLFSAQTTATGNGGGDRGGAASSAVLSGFVSPGGGGGGVARGRTGTGGGLIDLEGGEADESSSIYASIFGASAAAGSLRGGLGASLRCSRACSVKGSMANSVSGSKRGDQSPRDDNDDEYSDDDKDVAFDTCALNRESLEFANNIAPGDTPRGTGVSVNGEENDETTGQKLEQQQQGACGQSSLSLDDGSSLALRRLKIQKRYAQQPQVLAITDVTAPNPSLSKASYLRSTPARAVFFFRCVICGAVSHKHCANTNQDLSTTAVVLHEQLLLEKKQHFGAKALTAQLSGTQSNNDRILTPSSRNAEPLSNNSTIRQTSGLSRGGLAEDIELLLSSARAAPAGAATTASVAGSSVMVVAVVASAPHVVKHPLRIVNEFFDIDSLCSLRNEHERMETAESAAMRSGETLRKWVEKDRTGGGHGEMRNTFSPDASLTNRDCLVMPSTACAAVAAAAGGGASAIRRTRSSAGAAGVVVGQPASGLSNHSVTASSMAASFADGRGKKNNLFQDIATANLIAPFPAEDDSFLPSARKRRWQQRGSPMRPSSSASSARAKQLSPLRRLQMEQHQQAAKSLAAGAEPQRENQQGEAATAQEQPQPQGPSPHVLEQLLPVKDTTIATGTTNEDSTFFASTATPSKRLTFITSNEDEDRVHQLKQQQQQQRIAEKRRPSSSSVSSSGASMDPLEKLDRAVRERLEAGKLAPLPSPRQEQRERETTEKLSRAALFETLIKSSQQSSTGSRTQQPRQQHLFQPENYVHADKTLDEISLRILFRENSVKCKKAGGAGDDAQQVTLDLLPISALDDICHHVGLTGGQLIEMMARKDGVGRRFADLLARGMPPAPEKRAVEAERSNVTVVARSSGNTDDDGALDALAGDDDDACALQGFTVVDGGLTYEEFALAMSLVAQ